MCPGVPAGLAYSRRSVCAHVGVMDTDVCVLSGCQSSGWDSPRKGGSAVGMENKAGDRCLFPKGSSLCSPQGCSFLRQEALAQLIPHSLISLSVLKSQQESPTRAVPSNWIWRVSKSPGSPWPGSASAIRSAVFMIPLCFSLLTTSGAQASRFRE